MMRLGIETDSTEGREDVVSSFALLNVLPHELLLQTMEMLDERSLLRLSEANSYMHEEVIQSNLFQLDICVHCNKQFTILDNRNMEACILIRNKHHRKHKGKRVANQRELRWMQELVDQRFRIARGHQFVLDADDKETCANCQKKYLGYQVSNDAWQSNVPRHKWNLNLCMSCYLGSRSSVDLLKVLTVLLAIIFLVIMFLNFK